jgi:carboxynorspermidine decarboxylase
MSAETRGAPGPPVIRAGVSEEARRADVASLLDRAVVPRLDELPSPAVVMLDAVLAANLDEYAGFLAELGVGFLASVKGCTLDFVVRQLAARADGLDVSSLAEARLVRAFTARGPRVPLHFTSPSLSLASWEAIAGEADVVNLNSLEMLARIAPRWGERRGRLGLRVNPGISSAKDARYDPARPGSRLGVAAPIFERWVERGDVPPALAGLHFHTACEARSFAATAASLRWVERAAAPILPRLAAINLGGGWLRPALMADREPLTAAVKALRERGLAVHAEPGNGLARDAGVLMARVIDVVETGAGRVAILDTQVAHAPEVYEYGWSPDVHAPGNEVVSEGEGGHRYELAGCSCLAGDRFGVHRFRRPLELGQPVFFHDLGAYALAKASPFNGVLVPAVVRVTVDGAAAVVKPAGADAYHALWSTRPS